MPVSRFPETARLLAACQQVVDGSGDSAALASVIAARLVAIEHMHADFTASLAGFEPPEPLAWAAALDAVEVGYDSCRMALGEMREAAGARKRDLLRQGMIDFEAATEHWHDALIAVNDIRVQAGPTRWIPVNDLVHAPPPKVVHRVPPARTYLQHCRDEMQRAEPGSEATVRIVAAFDEALGAVAAVADAAESNDADRLSAARQQLSAACGEAAREIDAYRDKNREAGLAHAWRRRVQLLLAGEWQPEQFARDLDALDEQLRDNRSFYELLGHAHGTDVYVMAPIQDILAALESMREAAGQWRGALSRLNPGEVISPAAAMPTPGTPSAQLQAAHERFAAAVKAYEESSARLSSLLGRQGKIVCPRCEAVNEPHHKFCTNCTAVLPTGPQDVPRASFDIAEGAGFSDDRPVMTQNVHKLLEDTARYYDQKIDKTTYLASLDWMEGRLCSSEEELARRPGLDADAVRAQLDAVLEAARSGQAGGMDAALAAAGTDPAAADEPHDFAPGDVAVAGPDDPFDMGLGQAPAAMSLSETPGLAEGEPITAAIIADAEARAAELLRIVALSADTRELMSTGTTRMRAGLMCLRQFADSRERSDLADGVSTLWEGSQQIVQAMRVAHQIETTLSARQPAEDTSEPDDQVVLRAGNESSS